MAKAQFAALLSPSTVDVRQKKQFLLLPDWTQHRPLLILHCPTHGGLMAPCLDFAKSVTPAVAGPNPLF